MQADKDHPPPPSSHSGAAIQRNARSIHDKAREMASQAADHKLLSLACSGELQPEDILFRPSELLRQVASEFPGLGYGVSLLPCPTDRLKADRTLVERILHALVLCSLENGHWKRGAILAYEHRSEGPSFLVRPGSPLEGTMPGPRPSSALTMEDVNVLAQSGLDGRVGPPEADGTLVLTLPSSCRLPSPRPPVTPSFDGAEWQPPTDQGCVLVVDDSRTVRTYLEEILSREHRVFLAESGPEAILMAIAQRPDLVLLDAIMPGMDGYAVCARLKSDPRTEEIPVLFLTSLKGEADETLALEAGAIDFISKPITAGTVAARVRNHMALKRAQDRVREASLLDGLTGIANRRRFDHYYHEEWSRALRHGSPLALLMGDVDFFKRYNDACGHSKGDECLKAVGRCFAMALQRGGDLAARYGGEEFVCILPNTSTTGALAVAERLQNLLRTLQLPHPASSAGPYVSLSLGVASLIPHLNQEEQVLLEAADRGLYQAKRSGRDCIALDPGAGED